jgi:hypothetical protein
MPIRLTTAMNAGDIDPDSTYDHVRIVRQSHDAARLAITLDLEYGTLSGSDWIPGPASPSFGSKHPPSVRIAGDAYMALVTKHMTFDGELTYAAVKRGLYEWLQTNYAALAGTII